MKLNNQQVEALASKFQQELKSKEDKEIQKTKETKLKSLKADFDKAQDILKRYSFLTEINYCLNGKGWEVAIKRKDTFNTFSDSWTVGNFLKDSINSKIPSITEIKNEIILATIDATSIEEIMNNLKKKFK